MNNDIFQWCLDMNDYKNLTRGEFIKLSSEEMAKIVRQVGRPKVGVYLPDGSRRAAMFLQDTIPDTKDYYQKILGSHIDKFIEDIRIMFEDGLDTLIIPCLKHSNYERNETSMKIIFNSVKTFFNDERWLKLYDDLDVKVNVYGDFTFVKERGYNQLIEYANEVRKKTSNNKSHKLFWGITASSRHEIPRIIEFAIEFYKKYNRKPEDSELLKLYYGDDIEDVDFLIRATELRDSDMQPPIISGVKTQMYFLVAPTLISFTKENYRKIIYDLIFCRTKVLGNRDYYFEDLKDIDTQAISQFYNVNKSSIIGLGGRIGKFWLPNTHIVIPENLKEKFDNK